MHHDARETILLVPPDSVIQPCDEHNDMPDLLLRRRKDYPLPLSTAQNIEEWEEIGIEHWVS